MRRRAGSKRLLAQATRIIKIASAVQDRNLRRRSRRRSGVRDKPDGGSAGGGFMSEVDIFGSNGKGADYVTSQAPRNDNHAASIAANRPARQRGELIELMRVFEIGDDELVDYVWRVPRIRELLWRKFIFRECGKIRAMIRNQNMDALERSKSARHAARARWGVKSVSVIGLWAQPANGSGNGAGGKLLEAR